jgi:hypothetical protein
MRSLSLALTLLATPLAAETVTLSDLPSGGDTATLEMQGTAQATLTYRNLAAQQSVSGQWPITADHLTCTVALHASEYEERATVECPPGWIVKPEYADVLDGDEAVFMIRYAGF